MCFLAAHALDSQQSQINGSLSQHFKAHRAKLLKFVMLRGCSREQAEDIVQDAFLRLQKVMPKQDLTSVKAYLTKICLHLIYEYRRKDQKEAVGIDNVQDWQNQSIHQEQTSTERDRQRLGLVLMTSTLQADKGKSGYSEFTMAYRDEMSSFAIAAAIGSNAPTVRSRIQRFILNHKAKMEEILANDFYSVMQEEIDIRCGNLAFAQGSHA